MNNNNNNDTLLSTFQKDEALVVTDYSNKYAEWPQVNNNSSNSSKKIQFSPTISPNIDSSSTLSSPLIDNINNSVTTTSPNIEKKIRTKSKYIKKEIIK